MNISNLTSDRAVWFSDELSSEVDARLVHAGVPVGVSAEGQPLQPARLAQEESQATDDAAGDAHPRDALQG